MVNLVLRHGRRWVRVVCSRKGWVVSGCCSVIPLPSLLFPAVWPYSLLFSSITSFIAHPSLPDRFHPPHDVAIPLPSSPPTTNTRRSLAPCCSGAAPSPAAHRPTKGPGSAPERKESGHHCDTPSVLLAVISGATTRLRPAPTLFLPSQLPRGAYHGRSSSRLTRRYAVAPWPSQRPSTTRDGAPAAVVSFATAGGHE